MCNPAGIQFGKNHLFLDEVINRKVLEVGSTNVNGSLRESIEALNPSTYLGVDIALGKGVDEICDVVELVARYGKESFDVVIATELFEHVRSWREAISNLKNVLKPGGILIFTTRSQGFGYHGYPFDFWRYEVDDMNAIFTDLQIEKVEKDPSAPGVFVRARKPLHFIEANLKAHELYSMITRRRCRDIGDSSILFFKIKRALSPFLPDPMKRIIRRVAGNNP